eukprot:scaffold34248_cov19-Prasinocladus_malaysianus.AAC.1
MYSPCMPSIDESIVPHFPDIQSLSNENLQPHHCMLTILMTNDSCGERSHPKTKPKAAMNGPIKTCADKDHHTKRAKRTETWVVKSLQQRTTFSTPP